MEVTANSAAEKYGGEETDLLMPAMEK